MPKQYEGYRCIDQDKQDAYDWGGTPSSHELPPSHPRSTCCSGVSGREEELMSEEKSLKERIDDKVEDVKLKVTDCPSGDLAVKAYRIMSRGLSRGLIFMRFQDCVATVKNTETDEMLGEVSGCMGGGVEVHDDATGDYWFIQPEDLWHAVQTMIKARQSEPVTDNELVQPQPPPERNDSPAVWDLVMDDMKARDAEGRAKYGTPLQAHNGRDAMVDLYQELLDAVAYARQLIAERDRTAAKWFCERCGIIEVSQDEHYCSACYGRSIPDADWDTGLANMAKRLAEEES